MKYWVTNHPKSVRGLWPRRRGVVYTEGEPKANAFHTVGDFIDRGYVGVYADVPRDQQKQKELVMSQQEL